MTTPVLFKEYIWLVNTIYQARNITLDEINRKWVQTDMSGGIEIARSTFGRHKDAIEDIFGIYIECDRKNGYQYYIGNAEVLSEESIQNWMLSTLSVNHVISESLSLQKRILLEPIPSAKGYLEMIIEAMKKKRLITIQYRKYGADEAREFLIAPYCIKLYHRRWYVLGRYETGDYSVFSFDRIKELTINKDTFELDEDFDAEDYFSECYGVVRIEEVPVERIVLRAYGDECHYLRDLPIHQSQMEIGSGDGYSDFECYVRPTLDFCGQILSRGNRLQVLKPQSLADKIRQMLADALKNYEQK
jgi:hypothetical protein